MTMYYADSPGHEDGKDWPEKRMHPEDSRYAWDRLETPPDWHEPMFVPISAWDDLPLWVTILAACGLWGVGYYLVVLGLYLWGVI